MVGKTRFVALAAVLLALAGCNRSGDQAASSAANARTPAAEAASAGGPSRASPTGGACGGIAGLQCSAKEDFCEYAEGQCKAPDAQGTCVARAEMCTQEYAPVCGCDGKTYGNACAAGAAGTSVAAAGECAAAG